MIYKNKEEEIINVKFPEKEGKFVIPEFIGDYQCKVIEIEEFANWSRLTEVVIPNSVEIIEDRAFWGCEKLEKVIIPEGCEKIEAK